MTSIVIGGPSTSYFPGAVPIKPKPESAAAAGVGGASMTVVSVSAVSNAVTLGNSMVRLPGKAMSTLKVNVFLTVK